MPFTGSYTVDACIRVTVNAGQTVNVALPPCFNSVQYAQEISLNDVTQPVTGSPASGSIACYYRADGSVASAGAINDGSAYGSFSRILRPGNIDTINRRIMGPISIFNPNSGAIVVEIHLGG